MGSRVPDNLYNLASFADSFLLPAAHAPRRHDRNPIWQGGSTVEAFLWLDLGVKLGAFPLEESRRLADSVAGSVVHAFKDAPILRTLFSSYHLQIVDRSLRDGRYFERDLMNYVGGHGLDRAFETAMLLALEFGRDRQAQGFCQSVNFGPEEVWKEVDSDPIDIGMLEACAELDEKVHASSREGAERRPSAGRSPRAL